MARVILALVVAVVAVAAVPPSALIGAAPAPLQAALMATETDLEKSVHAINHADPDAGYPDDHPPTSPQPLPTVPSRPIEVIITPQARKIEGSFCAQHWGSNCSQCPQLINKMPASLVTLNGRPRPHLLYLHVEKTGGSSIECATQSQPLVNDGLFTNLGHTRKHVVDTCKSKCKHGGVPAKVVISIREPYSWWRSLYTYGFVCVAAATCTKQSFAGFVKTMQQSHTSQSGYIDRECGTPCIADYYLHTETLEQDFLSLQRNLSISPLYSLPHTNPTRTNKNIPPTIFTQEVVSIIHQLDGRMFTEFGYRKRTDIPFELPSTDHNGRLL